MLEYAGEESRVRTCRTVVGSCESKEVNAAEAADTPFSSEWNICRPRKPPQSPPKVVCILPSSLFETGIYIYMADTTIASPPGCLATAKPRPSPFFSAPKRTT